MSKIHEYQKHIQADEEALPSADGDVVIYTSNPKGDFTVKERYGGGTPTVEVQAQYVGPDGTTGIIVDQSADVKYGMKMEGGGEGPVVENTTKCRVPLGAGVTSF